MNLASIARQPDGARERQPEDASPDRAAAQIAASRKLKAAFLSANIAHLKLRPLSEELVRRAEPSASLVGLNSDEPALSLRGHRLGTPPSDAELAELAAHDHQSVFVVFGIGLGHTARLLRALTNAPILVFEPDPGVLRSLLELGPTELGDFDIVCNIHDFTQIWPSIFGTRRSAFFIPTPGYADVFADSAAHLRQTVAELVQRSRVNDETHRRRAREWVSDVLANVELLREYPGFLALTGKYRGVPAFIVGAGPSLAKNGPHLLQAARKGLVFAVNSSVRALAHLKVEPQIVACMESIDVSHLLRGAEFMDRAVRAVSLSSHPSNLRTGKGPLLPLWEALPQLAVPLQELTGLPGVPVCGSVSTLAFALALRLGCSPIVFVGQDLAYTDGRAYAAGTAYEDSRVELSPDGRSIRLAWCDTLKQTHNVSGHAMHETEPLNEVPAWGGGTVITGIAFSAVRAWLESAAVVLERDSPDVRLVNATEGGARIVGFEELRLADLLSELPDTNIRPEDIAAAALGQRAMLSNQQIQQWAAAQFAAAERTRKVARRIRRLAEVALAGINKHDPNLGKRLSRLENAERALSQAVTTAPLLDAWSWGEVDRLMEEHQQRSVDVEESARRALEFEARFGRTIEQCARELGRELQQLSARLLPTD